MGRVRQPSTHVQGHRLTGQHSETGIIRHRMAYYNEHDPYAAQWLRNLAAAGHITEGDVDDRSIVDVQPGDVAGYPAGSWDSRPRGKTARLWRCDRPASRGGIYQGGDGLKFAQKKNQKNMKNWCRKCVKMLLMEQREQA